MTQIEYNTLMNIINTMWALRLLTRNQHNERVAHLIRERINYFWTH